jgi:hypothetical protein
MTCNFITRGNTTQECVNVCQKENVGDCLSFCNNKCSSIEMDALKNEFNEITNKIKMYQASEGNMYNQNQMTQSASTNSIDTNSLNNIADLDVKRNIIWKYLLSTYNINSMVISSSNAALQKGYNTTKDQDKIRNSLVVDMKKINNDNTTQKRLINSNIYDYKKTLNEIHVYKTSLIVLVILFIFPILYVPSWSPLSKQGAIVLWSIAVIGLVIYGFIEIVHKNKGRDDKNYDERNFLKPTEKVVLESKSAYSEESRSLHGDLDFDPKQIDIGNVNKYISTEGKCSIDQGADTTQVTSGN